MNIKKLLKKWTQYAGAGLAVVVPHGDGTFRVLLGKRRIHPGIGQWTFSGGKREAGESSHANALREANEEVNLADITALRPSEESLVRVWSSRLYRWDTWVWVLEKPVSRAPRMGRDWEFEELAWFPLDALPQPLHYGVRAAVRGVRRVLAEGSRKA